jgi:hypothetical protein
MTLRSFKLREPSNNTRIGTAAGQNWSELESNNER